MGIILVKDLSRLGRNYLDLGFYQEILFPCHHVRLISVNDNYDSFQPTEGGNGLNIALKNLKNEFYSRDLSHKISSSLEVQKQNGDYFGQLPYGYRKGNHKHAVLIDEEPAAVVRLIFHMAAYEKLNTRQISVWLNQWHIPTPSAYRSKRGNKSRVAKHWSGQAVCEIIERRSYTGDSELYKSHVIAMGSTRVKKIPLAEREIVSNTHEAIISREVFEKAQRVILRHVEKPKIEPSLLKGYLYCGCCGTRLKRYSTTDHTFTCDYHLSVPDEDCGKVLCDATQVEKMILDTIHKLSELADAQVRTAKEQSAIAEQERLRLQKQLDAKSKKLQSIKKKKLSLYEQMVNGKLTLEDYKAEKLVFVSMERTEAEEVTALELRMEQLRKQSSIPDEADAVSEYKSLTALTKETISALIKRVTVYPDSRIEIEFTFQDSFGKQQVNM